MGLGVLGWLGLSLVVGYVAKSIGRNFFSFFLLSIILSPLLGFVILAIKGKATTDEILDSTPHIFFCPECDSAYGGVKEQCSECPNCGNILIETKLLRDDWRTYSEDKKAEIKKCFKQGQFLRDTSVNTTNISQTDSFKDITRYKELLDSGIITQEEFDQKKKQLLGL